MNLPDIAGSMALRYRTAENGRSVRQLPEPRPASGAGFGAEASARSTPNAE